MKIFANLLVTHVRVDEKCACIVLNVSLDYRWVLTTAQPPQNSCMSMKLWEETGVRGGSNKMQPFKSRFRSGCLFLNKKGGAGGGGASCDLGCLNVGCADV